MSTLIPAGLAPLRPRTTTGSFVPASRGLMLGDAVRRVGRPLEVGRVVGLEGDLVKVRWYAEGPIDRRHIELLQRRV